MTLSMGVQARPDRRRVAIRRGVFIGTALAVAFVGIAAMLMARTILRAATSAPQVAHIKAGDVAPDVNVMTDHGRYHLEAAVRPLVLELFATWCPHCRAETQVLNELESRFGHSIDIVAVSASKFASDGNSPESQADVAAFARDYHTTYAVAYDGTGAVMRHYLGNAYPAIIVIDARRRRIASIFAGETDIAALSDALAKVRR